MGEVESKDESKANRTGESEGIKEGDKMGKYV